MRLLLPLLLLAACAEAPTDPVGDEALTALDELSAAPPVANACGDLTAYVHNAADTAAVVLEVPGLVAAANAQGQVAMTIALPDRRVTGQLWTGRHVTAATCTGVIMPPGPQIRQRMDLIGGTLRIRAVAVAGPPGMPPAANVDIELIDPSFGNGVVATAWAGSFVWPQVLGGGYFP